jgi:Zn finger protein HypA/HybF involved in hydrogenase expression
MSDKCQSCNHIAVCGDNVSDSGCKYEPKRVKCEDCVVATVDSKLVKVSELEHVKQVWVILPQNIFTYCPKCGTRIEVKE